MPSNLFRKNRYMKMFKGATDLDNLCRVPGVAYLRCVKGAASKGSTEMCDNAYAPQFFVFSHPNQSKSYPFLCSNASQRFKIGFNKKVQRL